MNIEYEFMSYEWIEQAYFNFISWGRQFYLNMFFSKIIFITMKLFLNYRIMFHEYVEA